jgi:hypothetical protein
MNGSFGDVRQRTARLVLWQEVFVLEIRGDFNSIYFNYTTF